MFSGHSWFGWYWLAWFVLVILTFFIPEMIAVAHHRMDETLSDALRRWAGISPRKPWRWLGIILFGGGLFVLIIHITAGWP